jgi:very-short-patch-repair endonuclease
MGGVDEFRRTHRQPPDPSGETSPPDTKRRTDAERRDSSGETDRRIVARAARSEGIISTRELLDAGLTYTGIRHRRAHGWLIRRHRGVYLVGAVAGPLAPEVAALRACGDRGAISHYAGTALWRMRARVDGPIDVSVVGGDPRHRPGIRVHNVRTLEWTTHRGIPVTTPARTLLDLAAVVSAEDLARAVEEARVLGLVTDADLHELLDRHPRRAGTAALRRELGEQARLTRSEAERRLLQLIRRAGLPLPETNVRVLGHEVDALWRTAKLIVEIDGFAAHGTRVAFERDRARDAQLVAAGYRVIRITWRRLRDEPERVIAQLAMAQA